MEAFRIGFIQNNITSIVYTLNEKPGRALIEIPLALVASHPVTQNCSH